MACLSMLLAEEETHKSIPSFMGLKGQLNTRIPERLLCGIPLLLGLTEPGCRILCSCGLFGPFSSQIIDSAVLGSIAKSMIFVVP